MIAIRDSVYINIKIDGRELSGPNLVSSIHLAEGAPVIAPSMSLVLNDAVGTLTKDLCLTDANAIVVTIGRTPDDINSVSRTYRSFNVRQQHSINGPTLHILGIYDAPKYTTESARDSVSGTSVQALQYIADKCQLSFDGPEQFNGRTVDDSQVWLNIAKSRGAFVQHTIARHAYMDDHSAMYACLSSLGVLKYRNIMDVAATPFDKVKYIFSHNVIPGDNELATKKTYIVNRTKEFSQSGTMNFAQNYGSVQVSDGVSGATSVDSKVDVKTGAPYLAINEQVSQTIGRSKMVYGPIDCGNVHSKYYRALYQNKRQLSLFSERLSIIVSDPTEVQLLDPVIYMQADHSSDKPIRITDLYLVVGKTIFVHNGNVFGERIELARMSITEKGEAELKAAEPTIARESSIPEVTLDPTANVAATQLPKALGLIGIAGRVEDAARSVSGLSGRLLDQLKTTQPSLFRMASNIKTYAAAPKKALDDLKSATNSVRQVRETAQRLKSNFDTLQAGVKSGNIAMIASGASSIAQSATYFRPDGVVANLSASLGVTQTLKTTVSMYNTVAGEMAGLRNAMVAVGGIGSEIDSVIGDMRSVVDTYNGIMGDVGSTYNGIMSAVTGQDPTGLFLPNIEVNRSNFESMIRDAISPVVNPISEVSYTVPTVADIQTRITQTIMVKDDTRNYCWVPTSGYLPEPTTVNQMSERMGELLEFSEAASRQYADRLHDGSAT